LLNPKLRVMPSLQCRQPECQNKVAIRRTANGEVFVAAAAAVVAAATAVAMAVIGARTEARIEDRIGLQTTDQSRASRAL
jgi:hypothetical protein